MYSKSFAFPVVFIFLPLLLLFLLSENSEVMTEVSLQLTRKHSTGQFHQRSTSSFYEPESQKRNKDSHVVIIFALFGSGCKKAALRTMVKLTPRDFFHFSITFFRLQTLQIYSLNPKDTFHECALKKM